MSVSKRLSIPVVLLLVFEIVFLLLYFPPSLILEPTVTAGGDTPSHFISALAMRNPFSFFSPVTWFHGNFAGFPLFLHYFPLPFLLIGLISLLTSIAVSFKLVTMLAVIPLPAAVFYCLRRMAGGSRAPALGSILSLPFLMMEENHMWGGNIASTLAGEFAYGISFILAIILLGRIYSDAPNRRSLLGNSFIESLIALSNGYPILQVGMGTSYFLLRGGSTRYILCMHALAFALAAFWLLPLLFYSSWNSPLAHWWSFRKPFEFLPPLLWPSIAGAVIGLCFHARKLLQLIMRATSGPESRINPEQYLWWQFGISLLGFGLAPYFGLVDVRFLPFTQIFIVMLGAIGWSKLIGILPRPRYWLAVFAAAMIVFTFAKSTMVESWIRWNYSGMEAKPLWKSYSEANRFLEGTENAARVAWEHSEIINGAGSTRALEMLPHYSGRSTLEGLYTQSSLSTPFVFYIQSEISQAPTTPMTSYYYSRFDPDRAANHLRLFNVNQMVAVTENTRNALDSSPEFEPQSSFPPFMIYSLKNAPNSYIEPLRFRPLRIPLPGWRKVQYDWFRLASLDVPLIVAPDDSPGDFLKTIPVFSGSLENLPKVPISGFDNVEANAFLAENHISITTSVPGHPLWIKVSYHPCWRIARGEGELYPVSPAFMLLIPKTSEVILEFDTGSGIYLLGKTLSLLAVALCGGILGVNRVRKARASVRPISADPGEAPRSCSRTPEEITVPAAVSRGPIFPARARLIAAAALMIALISVAILARSRTNPQLLHDAAAKKFEQAEQIQPGAESNEPEREISSERDRLIRETMDLVERNISNFPDSAVFDYCIYFKAWLLIEEKKTTEARTMLLDFLRTHPDTRVLSECLSFLGETYAQAGDTDEAEEYFRRAALIWPASRATRHAGMRLGELIGFDAVFSSARNFFESGEYLKAYSLFMGLTFHADERIRDRSILWLGYCCFEMERWEEAANLFLQWLNVHFDSPESPQAKLALMRCNVMIDAIKAWQGPDPEIAPLTPVQKLFRFFNLEHPA